MNPQDRRKVIDRHIRSHRIACTDNHNHTEQFVPVESIKVGEFVKRKQGANKVYRRGKYDAATKRYSLEDYEDANREVFVKKGTILFVGFTY